jgi:hypothetical protein
MLDKLIQDLLLLTLRKVEDEDILAVALTCKKLYSLCNENKTLFGGTAIYNKDLKKSMRSQYIKGLIIYGKSIHKNMFGNITNFKSLESIKIEYDKDQEIDKNINSKLGVNIQILYIKSHIINVPLLRKFVLNNRLISLTLIVNSMPWGNDWSSDYDDSFLIEEIGRSYKEMNIIDAYDEDKFEKYKLLDSEGLQIFQVTANIEVDRKFLNDHSESLRHIYLDPGMFYDIKKDINSFTNLVSIKNHCNDMSMINANKIKELTKLEMISTYMKNIDPSTFIKLKNLKQLYLHKCDNSIIDFTTLTELRCLRLCLDDSEFSKLFCLKNLRVLILNMQEINIEYRSDNYVKDIYEIIEEYDLDRSFNIHTFPYIKLFIYKWKIWERERHKKRLQKRINRYDTEFNLQIYYDLCSDEAIKNDKTLYELTKHKFENKPKDDWDSSSESDNEKKMVCPSYLSSSDTDSEEEREAIEKLERSYWEAKNYINNAIDNGEILKPSIKKGILKFRKDLNDKTATKCHKLTVHIYSPRFEPENIIRLPDSSDEENENNDREIVVHKVVARHGPAFLSSSSDDE